MASSYLDAPQGQDLLITGLSLYRYDPSSVAIRGAHPTDAWPLSGYDPVNRHYALKGGGRGLGAGGGAFGGDPALSALPLPQAWAMPLAGLGCPAWRPAAGRHRNRPDRPAPQ